MTAHSLLAARDNSRLALRHHPSLATTPACINPHPRQLSRAMRIQSEYLNKTAHELQDKRKAAEAQVETGGILGLGLLQSEGGQAQEAKA